MRTVDIELGNIEYQIAELPTRKNEQWRQELETVLDPLLAVFGEMSGVEVTGDNLAELIPSAELVAKVAMKSPDTIREMVFKYSPVLDKDREQLLDNAYDSEFVEAFTAILGLAYPFGGLVRAVRQITTTGG